MSQGLRSAEATAGAGGLGAGRADDSLPALDGLRAVAALSVVMTHIGTLTGLSFRSAWGPYLARADVGVAVFFLLSGFLLGRPFLRAVIDGTPGPATASYLKRRVLRIFPAYWLVFAFAALALGIVGTSAPAVLSQVFLVHIYTSSTTLGPAIHSATGDLGYPLGPSWTLAVEISFYAFLPVFAAALAALASRLDRAGRLRLVAVALVALGAGSLAARAVLFATASPARAELVGAWLPLNLDWFCLGMGLAVLADRERSGELGSVLRRMTRSRLTPVLSVGLAVLSFVAVSKWVGLDATQAHRTAAQSMARQVLYGAVGFFLLVPATLGRRRTAYRATLGGVPLRQLGLISYGVYLWQDVVIDQYLRHTDHRYFAAPFWSSLAFVVAGSVLVATVSYWAVERPALSLKGRRLLPRR